MVSQTNEKALTAEAVLQTLREQSDLFEQYKIKTLALFGSTARHEASETSDLDFVVEFVEKATFKGYMGLKFHLEDLFNRPVDLVTKKSIKPLIRDQILGEATYV